MGRWLRLPSHFSIWGVSQKMNESLEVRVVRLEEQLKFLVEDAKEAGKSRKGQYESMESLRQAMVKMAGEVTEVKTKLAGQAPTIEEFITIKHKVVGAGKVGKWLWAAGAFLIGSVYSSREAILHWLTK